MIPTAITNRQEGNFGIQVTLPTIVTRYEGTVNSVGTSIQNNDKHI